MNNKDTMGFFSQFLAARFNLSEIHAKLSEGSGEIIVRR